MSAYTWFLHQKQRPAGTRQARMLIMWLRGNERQIQSHRPLMTGLAGSHGPITTFLYFCNPISHQLHPPMVRHVSRLPSTTPAVAAFHPPPETVTPTPPPAPMTRNVVRRRWPRQELWRRCRRNTGKRPKTSMEKRVKEKT